MHYCPHTSKWCKNDTACVAVGECLQASGVKFANEKPPPPAAPTLEQRVKSILDEIDIEQKTMTSLVHPPLAVWYGLNDPRDILEFARRLTNRPSQDT